MKGSDDFFDVAEWWEKIRNNKAKFTIGATFLLVAGGVGAWFQEQIGKGLDWLTGEGTPSGSGVEGSYSISVSSQVPHCQTGFIPNQFRHWDLPLALADGADRLVICGDIGIPGTRDRQAEMLREFSARLPECLRVREKSGTFTISANLGSAFLCRAPFRFEEERLLLDTGQGRA